MLNYATVHLPNRLFRPLYKQRETMSLQQLAISRLRALPSDGARVSAVDEFKIRAFAASLGFDLVGEIRESLADSFPLWAESMERLKGDHVAHAPLFTDFPNHSLMEVPFHALLVYASAGFWLSLLTLINGIRDPAQHPFRDLEGLKEALRREQLRPLSNSATKLVTISLVSPEEFYALQLKYVTSQFYGSSAIMVAAIPELAFLPHHVVEPEKVVVRENLAVLASLQPKISDSYAMLRSSVDVLRFMAVRTGGDHSLKEPIRFPKLSNGERRMVMETLSRDGDLDATLLAYEGLWKAISRGLHPHQYAKTYPVAVRALRELYSGELRSWYSRMEELMPTSEVLSHMKTRPTVFARQLERLLCLHGQVAASAFGEIADRVSPKILHVLRAHLLRAQYDRRMVTLKNGRTKVLPSVARPDDDQILACVESIDQALRTHDMKRPSLVGKSVWIDPRCFSVIAPYWQRSASDGLHILPRGSRIPIGDTRLLRFFVYWKGEVDLDLSVVQESHDGSLTDVAFYRLQARGIKHSGDIQSAPNGASEFVDVEVDIVRQNIRRLYVQVYRYRGRSSSSEFFGGTEECFVGYMSVSDTLARVYDPKTVENVLRLKSKATYATPMALDLETNEVVILDQFGGAGLAHQALRKGAGVKEVVDMVLRSHTYRPVAGSLAATSLRNRGANLVSTPESADIVVSVGILNTASQQTVVNVLDPGQFSAYFD